MQQRRAAFDPTQPVLIVAAGAEEARAAFRYVLGRYPEDHPAKVVDAAGQVHQAILEDVSPLVGEFAFLYLPPLDVLKAPYTAEAIRYIVARLRGPGGCPWDREQTHATLKPFLIEEAYETYEALEEQDAFMLREELGDLLLQVLLHAQLAAESGHFTMDDVQEGIARKLLRRHPHVFGQVQVENAQQVLLNWDAIKRDEKKGQGSPTAIERAPMGHAPLEHPANDGASAVADSREVKSILSGVPRAMPALAYAQSVQRRAARAGFDWPDIQGVLDKVQEEVQELMREEDKLWELGDLLFAIVNLARWLKVDAEEALRQANARFYRRFTRIEALCAEQGLSMENLSLEELDTFWEKAKAEE